MVILSNVVFAFKFLLALRKLFALHDYVKKVRVFLFGISRFSFTCDLRWLHFVGSFFRSWNTFVAIISSFCILALVPLCAFFFVDFWS